MVVSSPLPLLLLLFFFSPSVWGQAQDTTASLPWQPSLFEDFQPADTFLTLIEESRVWETEEKKAFWTAGYETGMEWQNDTLIHHFAKNLGSMYLQMDSISKSLQYLNQALEHSYDLKAQSVSYNLIGALHMKGRDYPAALDFYYQSLEAAKQLQDGTEVYAIGNISTLYGEMNNYQKAIEYLQRSVGYADQLTGAEKHYSLAYDYAFMASYYQDWLKPDSAVKYLDLALGQVAELETLQETKFDNACFIGYATATELYLKQENADKAEYFLQQTRKFAKTFYVSSIIQFEIRLALLKKEYSVIPQLLAKEKLLQHREDLLKSWEISAQYYQATGDFEALAQVQKKILAETERRFEKEQVQFSVFANGKYETLKKNEEIKALQLNQEIQALTIQKQQTGMLLIALLVVLLAIVAIFLWQRFRNRKQLSILLQQEVEAKTRDLVKVNQELRTLSHIASHDIKEPIRNIGSYLGLVKRRLPPAVTADPEVADFFANTKQSIAQLYTLVEDSAKYLSLSAKEELERSTVDVNELADQLLFSLQTYMRERNGVVHLAPFPKIHSNRNMLWIIFKNLLENGLKFNEAEQPTVEVRYQQTAESHVFSFVDNGIGIAAPYHAKIMEPYQRLHQRGEFKGSGIGLSIVQLLVQKLGGMLSIQSQLGQGTTIRISFPIHL
ncbi:MAG: ATP-binding protein [Bacteroidota bacterium]